MINWKEIKRKFKQRVYHRPSGQKWIRSEAWAILKEVSYEIDEKVRLDHLEHYTSRKRKRGFTLTELMICIMIIGIVSAFAMVNYTKALRRQHEVDMVNMLQRVYEANNLYKIRNDLYYKGYYLNVNDINEAFNLGIIAQETDYLYSSIEDEELYSITAKYQDFEVCMTERNKVCCSQGSCPKLPACQVVNVDCYQKG